MNTDNFAFCAIPLPTLVYAGPKTKEEFDRLALPETVHEWEPCSTTTVIKHDGNEWERRCHSKTMEQSGVIVVFQWFDERQEDACSRS